MADPFNLKRFVQAQDSIYESVVSELRDGQKRGHWMWFIFPQIKGLGSSLMAREYAIGSLDEAVAYLQHEVLGPRLFECTKMVIDTQGVTINQIFGYPDNMKFISSMTLFALSSTSGSVFEAALRKFGTGYDQMTVDLLKAH
jgi:uncharacterized protein (DUF1810 family)